MTLSMWLLTIILVSLVVLLVKFQQHTTAIFGSVLVLVFALGWVDSTTLLGNAANAIRIGNISVVNPYCICIGEDQRTDTSDSIFIL